MIKRLILILSILLAGCRAADRAIDLTQRLQFAERKPDSQVFLFGSPQSSKFLHSGWSEPEKQTGGKLRWMNGETASFSWDHVTPSSSYLHFKIRSEEEIPLEILVRGKPIWYQKLDPAQNIYSVLLPDGIQEVSFKKPPEKNLGFYSAAISVSPEAVRIQKLGDYPSTDLFQFRNKVFPSWSSDSGGSITFFEEIEAGDTLEFGYSFRPQKESKFALFRVLLWIDGQSPVTIFYRNVDKSATSFARIAMAKFLSGSSSKPCKLTFEIQKNTLLDGASVAWIQPRIIRKQDSMRTTNLKGERIPKPRNVVLILLDAAAAKHLGCYGYKRNTTPNLDRLASESILFENAYTNAVYTLASTATLFTGKLPHRHKILLHKNKLPEKTLTLAEILRDSGFRTSAFLANGNASGIFGFTQGFQTVEDVFRKKDYVGWGSDITESFLKWLPENKDQRFFAYLHFREPHEPYNPPEEWVRKFVDPAYEGNVGRTSDTRGRANLNSNQASLTEADRKQIQDLYDANLAYADSEVQRLIQALKHFGIYDSTMIIVTADHGEAFWEHGYQGHNRQLYEESARIPFIVRIPGSLQPARIPDVYQTVDLLPSLMEILDLPSPRTTLDGRSFVPSLFRSFRNSKIITIRSTQISVSALVKEEYKYIRNEENEELYHLKKDPSEKVNLILRFPVLAGFLRQQLLESLWEQEHAAEETVVMDEEAKQNLKALGYID